jgi:hypothetical protein
MKMTAAIVAKASERRISAIALWSGKPSVRERSLLSDASSWLIFLLLLKPLDDWVHAIPMIVNSRQSENSNKRARQTPKKKRPSCAVPD